MVGIPDVIAERFPQYVFNSPRARLFWNLKTRVAIWQATRILTVSEHARRGIQDYFHLPPEKIRVTHEAPAAAFHPITNRAKIHAAFERIGVAPAARVIMCLGGITPHKNVQMLVAVFADLIRDARFADMKLVVAGDYAREVFYSEFPQLRAQAKASCGDAVVFTGYVDDETAAQLLNGSCVCVLPSFDEGFGLPGIEAAACGTPLIATQSSAMPELLGDAAIYIDPTKPAELRAALECVLQDADRRRTMSDKSIERASKLTWDSAARRVEQMFEELL